MILGVLVYYNICMELQKKKNSQLTAALAKWLVPTGYHTVNLLLRRTLYCNFV